jgi:hypothetical protein
VAEKEADSGTGVPPALFVEEALVSDAATEGSWELRVSSGFCMAREFARICV